MKPHYFLVFTLIIVLFVAGCTSESSSTAQSSANAKVSDISEEQKQSEILATATHAYVDARSKNWDADPEDDGIIVYPELKDTNDETVKFESVNLPVDIEIYTTKYDDSFKEVKDRLIYSGSGEINSWKDGNFMFSGGIKVSYEDIKAVSSDREIVASE